jgi:hypothetical protein
LSPTRPAPRSILWGEGLLLAVGIGVTDDPDLTLPKATGLIWGIAIFRFLVVAVRHRSHLNWAMAAYALLGAALILPGALAAEWRFKIPFIEQLLGQLPPQLLRLPESSDAGVSLNQLAGTILLYWPLLLALIPGWRSLRYRQSALLAAALLWLLLTGLLLVTQSRSAWIGALAGLLVLAAMWSSLMPPSRHRRLAGTLLLLLLLSGVVTAWLAGPERWQRMWLEPPGKRPSAAWAPLPFAPKCGSGALWPFMSTASVTPWRRVLNPV